MSSKINTVHIPEQDGLFKAILSIGVDYLVDKDCFAAIDKKSFNFITRRQRRKDNTEEEKDKDIDKHFILVLPEGISKLQYKDTVIAVEVTRETHPVNILEHMKFKN